MVADAIEPIELAQGGPDAMRPISIRSITLDDSDLRVHGHFAFTEALINTCTEVDIALDLGLMWLADSDAIYMGDGVWLNADDRYSDRGC